MRNTRILILVEVALAVALAFALNLYKIDLPFGGAIKAAMLPILVVALRRGAAAGAAAGALFGLLDLLMGAFIIHWIQLLLDYPLPYAVFGFLAGLFSGWYHKLSNKLVGSSVVVVLALIIGGIGRIGIHVVSGAVFFAEYAGEQNAWVYSLAYNLSYLAPSLAITLVLALIILPILGKAVPVKHTAGQSAKTA